MPQKRSAYKNIRKDKKRHLANQIKISEIKTVAKKVAVLIDKKDKEKAEIALRLLESKMCKAAKTHTMKKITVSRRISRLRARLSKVAGEKGKAAAKK